MVYALMISFEINYSNTTLLHKKQCNIYDTIARPVKLGWLNRLRWGNLLEVGESKYEQDIIMRQIGNGKD